MSSHRWLVLLLLLLPGCAEDPVEEVARAVTTSRVEVTTSSSSTSTTTSTTGVTTTAPVTPVVTRPLTTAPPSDLLTEVVAAYDAAYEDLLAAEAVMDENHPALDDHIAGAQLERLTEVIRGHRFDGHVARTNSARSPWRRVEKLTSVSADEVDLEVCRFDNTDLASRDGVVLDESTRPFRYRETVQRIGGEWKWVAREWIDPSASSSDCASS